MRRVVSRTVAVRPTAVAARGVYSIWGTVVHEANELQEINQKSLTERLSCDVGTKGFELQTVPELRAPRGLTLSEPEKYLLSCIADDTRRIQSVDWTVEFDSFWRDRIESHKKFFVALYAPDPNPIYAFIFGNYSANTDAKLEVQRQLNYLESMLKWAEEAEKVYSSIAKARFRMQREVFNAFERERILAGCVLAVEEFKGKVPAEFNRKAVADVSWHLDNMRHWVWDAPNAKREFKRALN